MRGAKPRTQTAAHMMDHSDEPAQRTDMAGPERVAHKDDGQRRCNPERNAVEERESGHGDRILAGEDQ